MRIRFRREAIVLWGAFTASAREAEQLARDAEFDSMALLLDHFAQLRRYSPTYLETFDFRAASARQDLTNAIEVEGTPRQQLVVSHPNVAGTHCLASSQVHRVSRRTA